MKQSKGLYQSDISCFLIFYKNYKDAEALIYYKLLLHLYKDLYRYIISRNLLAKRQVLYGRWGISFLMQQTKEQSIAYLQADYAGGLSECFLP